MSVGPESRPEYGYARSTRSHLKVVERAQKWMPDLTAEIISDAGHLLIMDRPEIINARILQFLRNRSI